MTKHVTRRIQQRSLSAQDVEYVVRYGRRHWAGGVLHCFLGRNDIPGQDRHLDYRSRLEGTTVLLRLNEDQTIAVVITAYRNRKASRQFRRKKKYNFKKRRAA